MIAEHFQLIDGSKMDDSFLKTDFIKLYHQHGAEVNVENKKINFHFGENPKYLQICYRYLELDIEIKKVDGTSFTDTVNIRLINNGLDYVFREGRLSTWSGTEIQNK